MMTTKRIGRHVKVKLSQRLTKYEAMKPYLSLPCALTEHHAIKAYWGSGDITPLIL
jgi:hypothetical protein